MNSGGILRKFGLGPYINDFKILPITIVYSFNDYTTWFSLQSTNTPLVRTKFTKTPSSSMKDIEIDHLQSKSDTWRHEAHKNPTNKHRRNFRYVRNEIWTHYQRKKTQF